MIRVHSKGPTPRQSFIFYQKIVRNSISPDNYTFNFLIRACAQVLEHPICLLVHGTVIKNGFEKDPHVQSGLIFMYAELGLLGFCYKVFGLIRDPDMVCRTAMIGACAKCGDLVYARKMFDEMPQRDPIAWNTMVARYAQCGESREALRMFYKMQLEGIRVNEVSMVSVLSACSHLGALDQGKWAHAYIERNRIPLTVTLGTSLIDMYAKCGSIEKAMEVFWEMKQKNVYTWSSAMNGLAMNGAGEKCLELFSAMKQDGIQPNEVTFISVLRGCIVAGFVEEGNKHFESMNTVYAIAPEPEHYGCMVDLYGRAGRLQDALRVIQNMPMKPHAGAWGALLNACRLHKNMELAEVAASNILEVDPLNHSAHVLLSNIYAETRNWEKLALIREAMKAKRVRKEPGCTVIEVNGEVQEFFAGDKNKSHPRYNEIEIMLGEIYKRLRLAGYVANTKAVMHDIEEEEKEDALNLHSEKVAIAFGLISLEEGLPIRIAKNLRVCWDCHVVCMMISKVFNREIIARDRNRFHHFRDGECSCKGYW